MIAPGSVQPEKILRVCVWVGAGRAWMASGDGEDGSSGACFTDLRRLPLPASFWVTINLVKS